VASKRPVTLDATAPATRRSGGGNPPGRGAGQRGGVTGKGFVPGKSGNPLGKKNTSDLTTLARTYTVDAIHALVAALQKPRERVAAATALLDRGWGKPVQMITGDANQPLVVDFRWADSTPVVATPVIDAKPAEILEAVWQESDASERVQQWVQAPDASKKSEQYQ
jgi:hypothetical protein